MKFLVTIAIALLPAVASAGPITFNLRDPAIELIDEVNSFSLTLDGLTAVLTATPGAYLGHNLVLNQTTSAFGVNVEDLTCSGEDSDELDGGCVAEAVQIVFNSNVLVNSLRVSSFGTADAGLATIGSTTKNITSTGVHALGDVFLAAGNPWSLSYVSGRFSFDNFTATTVHSVPEPSTLLMLGAGAALIGSRRRTRAA